MYSILVFLHVISAVFLGSFLTLPLLFQFLASRTGSKIKNSLSFILYFTRFGHYALIMLFLSGGWMVIGYSSYPSSLWVTLSSVLLILIGALMGMMSKRMKSILRADDVEKSLQKNLSTLKAFGWLTFILVIVAVFIMTNRQLFY